MREINQTEMQAVSGGCCWLSLFSWCKPKPRCTPKPRECTPKPKCGTPDPAPVPS